MQIDGNKNVPFSLFISSQRRRKIIQSMQGKSEGDKREGEKILNNYKKQLAEKMARDHMENIGNTSNKFKSRSNTLDNKS